MGRPMDVTRDSIVRAARHLLATEGPSALTVRRIAAEAGGSTMHVYSRLGGKDGVIEALVAESFDALREALAAGSPTGDPFDDLRAWSSAYRAFALDDPSRYAVMFGTVHQGPEARSGPLRLADEVRRPLAARFARALGARPTSVDPDDAALSLWAGCHGLVTLELQGMLPSGAGRAASYDATVTALLRGLTA